MIALVDALLALAVAAWVGGHAALGAFAARIVFRDLPRVMAAPTMNAVFRSFDRLIACALVVVLAATVAREWLLGSTPPGSALAGRRRLSTRTRADALVRAAAALLVAVGLFEVLYLHPRISELFEAGRTLDPAFASLHRLSERCGHLEVALAAAIYGGQAWSRARLPYAEGGARR
jgi:hypothetical protein